MTTDLQAMARESCFVASLALASGQLDLVDAALDDAVAALQVRADGLDARAFVYRSPLDHR